MITIDSLNATESIASSPWAYTTAGISMASFLMPTRASIEIEQLERLPHDPVIVAMNHTHKFDFLALRAPLLFKGRTFVSWVKSRAYMVASMNTFLSNTGNVPLCSRGYIIAADYADLFGERIDEQTYRAIREHVDRGAALPQTPVFEKLQNTPRAMLGWQFNPSGPTYRAAIESLYYEMMQISLRLTRRCINRGDHVHIYPQGSISGQLTPGRSGIIQAALAFGLPIMTVGVSGTRETFISNSVPFPKRKGAGNITVRFGNLHMIPREDFPDDFRPFHPVDERKHRTRLQAHTQTVMEDLNEQLTPAYQWADDMQSDAKTGVNRFF